MIVAVLDNSEKKYLFSADARSEMLRECLPKNIEVEAFSGLCAEFCKGKNANGMVKGIRAAADYDYEKTIAKVNAQIGEGLETALLFAKPEYEYLSSTVVREYIRFGKNLDGLVPAAIINKII